MCMVGDDDFWEWYTEKRPKVRKPFNCCECGRLVRKGETYVLQGGIHDRQFLWNKTCAQCDEASEWLGVVCDGWIFERREEDFLEHVIGSERYLRSRPLVRLVRWMRADWRDRDGYLRSAESVKALTGEAIQAYRNQRRLGLPA